MRGTAHKVSEDQEAGGEEEEQVPGGRTRKERMEERDVDDRPGSDLFTSIDLKQWPYGPMVLSTGCQFSIYFFLNQNIQSCQLFLIYALILCFFRSLLDVSEFDRFE